MKTESTTLVIGGGVIGLCSAYFLARAGERVTVIDRDSTRRESCSDRNAGMVVPSHFIPLAAPGVISQGLKWMLDRRSPFYLRPRLDRRLAVWLWHFLRHANRRHVGNSRELLRDLSLESRSLFGELAETLGFELVERGLLMLCRSEAGLRDEIEVAEEALQLGIEAEVCEPERLRELDPAVEMDALGGVWYPRDAHLDPTLFLAALRRGIRACGGEFRDDEITGFSANAGQLEAAQCKSGERLGANRFVIAGGAWTPALARHLGLELPMQAGKGYSFTLPTPAQLPALCSLLKEGRVAVTPMGPSLRVGGTMEIGGNDLGVDRRRLEGIATSFCRFFPRFSPRDFDNLEPWVGLRPCSPDGLPYLGRTPRFSNAIIATGHAMLGLSLGPVTGRLVRDLALESVPTDVRIAPSRF
ncbi:MAG: FAD-dependent oxidoreductase [Verrucomicrobiae bacterium]|nr:FAD-dependent oxidoreductase [Verrucomicrobiae bacterium]